MEVEIAKWEYWKEKVDNFVSELSNKMWIISKETIKQSVVGDINAVIGIEKIEMRRFIVYI